MVCEWLQVLLPIINSLRSFVSTYVNRKRPQIDIIGAQMQMSYRKFVRNFSQIIPYDDTFYVFLFLVQSNESAAVFRQSLML